MLMIKADVPQDVTEYKEQFFFGMNSRQLICSVLMIALAVLIFLVGSKFISTDILVYITIFEIAPLAAVGFLKYNGMGFEKIAATVMDFYVSNQRRRMEYIPEEMQIHDAVREIYIRQLEEDRRAEKKNMKRKKR
ncbi:PrgI family protein [Huintestinicola butyrica]|uniref:PrgI family protein n=1 Tax=Huintestinicola butyrica TaxID=2981728 RepID=UPI003F7D6CAC